MIRLNKIYSAKHVPTLNIFDPTSIASWFKIRKISRHYGRNMTNRHELLIPSLFLYMIFVYMCNWLVGLDLVKLENSLIKDLSPFLKIDYAVFSCLILFLFVIYSRLNQFYEDHINSLMHLKSNLDEMQTF